MNNPIDSRIGPRFDCFMHKIYLFFFPFCCVQSYLLRFSYRLRLRFSLPLIKITARINAKTRNVFE